MNRFAAIAPWGPAIKVDEPLPLTTHDGNTFFGTIAPSRRHVPNPFTVKSLKQRLETLSSSSATFVK